MINLENLINSSIDKIIQNILAISEKSKKNNLEFDTATNYIDEIKGLVNELGCKVVKGYFESRDEDSKYILEDGKRHLLKGKSPKEIITTLCRIKISRNYYQHRSGGKSIIPLACIMQVFYSEAIHLAEFE